MPDRNTKLPFKVKTTISPPDMKVASLDAQARQKVPGMGSETFKSVPRIEGFKIMPKSRGK